MAVVDLHHSRRPVESKTAQKTVNKPGQHRHLTRFLSRDLPQHKHADRARNQANLLARNCILSPPLARHPLTTCACVCVVVRLGHFCNPSRFSTLARALFLSFCFILLSFRESFCVFSYFPSPLFLQRKPKLYTLCEMWQLSKIREKIHHFRRRRRRSPIPRARTTHHHHTVHDWGRCSAV